MEVQISEMSLAELRTLAKSRGIKSVSTLRKQELIDILGAGTEAVEEKKNIAGKGEAKKEVELTKPAKQQTVIKEERETKEEAGKEETGKEVYNKEAYNKEVSNREANNREANNKEVNSKELINKEPINKELTNKEADNKETDNKEEEKAASTQIRRNYRNDNNTDTRNTSDTRSTSGNQEGYPRRNPQNPQYTQNLQEDGRKNSYWQNGNQENEVRRSSLPQDTEALDSGETKEGILEVMPDGYGFIRCDNYLPGENDVYVSPAQIRRFCLKTGDIVVGNTRIKSQGEKFSALLFVKSVNGFHPAEAQKRKKFEDLTPIFPNERIHLETPGANVSMRMVDLVSPIGKGQRGMIVSQPKTGKTTLLKQIAKAITINHPGVKLIILLIDERPEEVTDIKESIEGKNVEVIYSTFDELPENHKRVSEMVIERAKRLVEHKQEVVILLDSITRLARAYNLTVQASGRTLSGGLDPAALHMPKRFFGAARNMREGGSLTILATALVDTGSRMDDVVFEEFKGTGNMELVLDRNLSEKRIFPAIDLPRSSTRRDDLLLSQSELEATYLMRKAFNSLKSDDAVERIIDMFLKTKTNAEFIETVKKTKLIN